MGMDSSGCIMELYRHEGFEGAAPTCALAAASAAAMAATERRAAMGEIGAAVHVARAAGLM